VPVEKLQDGDGSQIGRYTLLGRLGTGEGGVAYLGRAPGNRLVAIMRFREELAKDKRFRDDFDRWARDARRDDGDLGSLVVEADSDKQRVVEADSDERRPWLAVRYDDGLLLDAAAVRPLPPSLVIALAAGLARELAANGNRRDLKPSDVLITRDGPQLLAASAAPEPDSLDSPETVEFVSPEQAFEGPAGPASDIFRLGAVLAFAASGQKPYGTGSRDKIRRRILKNPPELGELPASLRSLIESCLDLEPTDRPTAAELLLSDPIAKNPKEADWDNALAQGWLRRILHPTERAQRRPLDRPDGAWNDVIRVDSELSPRNQSLRRDWALLLGVGPEMPPWWNWRERYPARSATDGEEEPIGPVSKDPISEKPVKRHRKAVTVSVTAAISATIAAAISVPITIAATSHSSPPASAPSVSPSATSSQAASALQEGQPANLQVGSPSSTVAETITWSAPASGPAPHQYEIWVNGKELRVVPGNATQYPATGLTPGDNYTFTVVAIGANGQSESSERTVRASGQC
jgi:serine/threonine protein kinase